MKNCSSAPREESTVRPLEESIKCSAVVEEINYTVHQYIPVGVVTFQRYSTKQKLPFEAFVLQDLKHFVPHSISCDRLGSREAPSVLPKNVNNKPVSGSEHITVECGSGRRFGSRHKCPE